MRRFTILVAFLAAVPAAAAPTTEREEQPAPPCGEADMVAQLSAAVAALRQEMYRPGEAIPGWDRGGADPDSELIAAGADTHYFLMRSPTDGPSVVILSPRRIADFAPAGWRIVDSYGSAIDAVDRPFLQFSWVSPRYVIATRSNGFRRNNIDCSDRVAHALLYEVPGETMSEDDQAAPFYFRLALLAMEGQTSCTRYEGSRASGWRMRPLLPDGRSLPALEREGDLLTIVEAGPVDALMRR